LTRCSCRSLSEAIRAARDITSRAAAARQRQYIGKLMRGVELEPIRAALRRAQRLPRGGERFKTHQRLARAADRRRCERPGGAGALAPDIDRAQWAGVSAPPSGARARRGAGAAARELFRALRALFDTMP